MTQFLLALVLVSERPLLERSDSLIVGRAACGAATWLLTDQRQLVGVSVANLSVVVHTVAGLNVSDRPWGLACLADSSMWTLAAPRQLARVGIDGVVRERVAATLPRVGIFAAGDRLLVQQFPIAAGAPVLVSTPPREPQQIRAWPGLVGRFAGPREQQIARNLVNCGIGSGGSLPCWFTDENRVVISDGARVRTIESPELPPPLDRGMPIWDFALSRGGVQWLLATADPLERRSARGGKRLYRTTAAGLRTSIDLPAAVRVILKVTDTECVVLTAAGRALEVGERPR